jgi:hypothetical protein
MKLVQVYIGLLTVTTLRRVCNTNVEINDKIGLLLLIGRKSIIKAQR